MQGRPQRSGRQAFSPPGQSWEAWTMPHGVLPVHGEVMGTVRNGGRGEPKNARRCGRLFHPRLQCCCSQAWGILRGAAPGSPALSSQGDRLHCSALGRGWAGTEPAPAGLTQGGRGSSPGLWEGNGLTQAAGVCLSWRFCRDRTAYLSINLAALGRGEGCLGEIGWPPGALFFMSP